MGNPAIICALGFISGLLGWLGDDQGSTRKLSEADDVAARGICEFGRDAYRQALLRSERDYCIFDALAFGDDVPGCEAALQVCLDSQDYERELADDAGCEAASAADLKNKLAPACDATIGELEACMSALFEGLGAHARALSCASLDDASLTDPADPAACVQIRARCPGLLED
jgi:hypothetical protein